VGTGRRLRWGRRNDGRRASSEAGATTITVARSEAKALGALVKSTVLFLVTLSSADETGIIESWVVREKDRVGLVKKSLPSVSSFLGLLGTQVGDSFLIRGWDEGRGDR